MDARERCLTPSLPTAVSASNSVRRMARSPKKTISLAPVAVDVATRASAMWRGDGVLTTVHATPLGELPGAVITNFAIIDAIAHAWDLSSSLGRAIEIDAAALPAITEVVAATCTDAAFRAMWADFEWENKVAVNTPLRSVRVCGRVGVWAWEAVGFV